MEQVGGAETVPAAATMTQFTLLSGSAAGEAVYPAIVIVEPGKVMLAVTDDVLPGATLDGAATTVAAILELLVAKSVPAGLKVPLMVCEPAGRTIAEAIALQPVPEATHG